MEDYIISLFLIACSATFSGLTLGYFTLDTQTLRRQAKLGDRDAIRILPIRERGNQLLTTLLLGNVTVNTILSVYLSSLASGVVAATAATALIFLFGEIIPQAAFARHAKWVGSTAAPLVRALLFVTYPITFPVAWSLNRLLGSEIPNVYSRHELMELISEHEDSEHSPIDADEERIVHGALQFSHRTVREVMTPKERVTCYDINQKLNADFFEHVTDEGYSRFPVYAGNPNRIVGILFTKDLLVEDENITIGETEEALERSVLSVKPEEFLDVTLGKMLKRGQHMAIVTNSARAFVGVITLEDIIEEIIQQEIEDEDDTEDSSE
jgi:metal transporter CNNM